MARSGTLPAGVVAAVAAAVLLNYFDRGSLATAAPVLQQSLALSSTQLGVLLSAFFWAYGPAQLLAGWLVHRFDVRVVLGTGVALWALATLLTGLASTFAVILALRLVLGLGECVTYPSWQVILSRHVPEHRRGRLTGIVAAGQGLGPMLGTLIGGLAMARYGWRVMFLGMGGATLLWLLPWWWLARRGAIRVEREAHDTAVGYREIFRQRAFWGMALGHFAGNYPFYFVLTWLPSYLVKVGGLSLERMAVVGGLVFGAYAAATIVAGFAVDRAIEAGRPAASLRRATLTIAPALAVVSIALCAVASPMQAIGLLLVTSLCFAPASATIGVVSATLAGPRAAGRWYAAQNLAGQVSGVLAPIVTGLIIDVTGHYAAAFLCAALLSLLSAFAFGVVVGRYEPVRWRSSPRSEQGSG